MRTSAGTVHHRPLLHYKHSASSTHSPFPEFLIKHFTKYSPSVLIIAEENTYINAASLIARGDFVVRENATGALKCLQLR